MENTKAFPKNTEVDVTTTFVSEGGGGRGGGPGQIGGRIADVTPTAEAVTLRLHHSFIELPDGNFKARAFDARSGFGGYDYIDIAAPLGEIDAEAVHPSSPDRKARSVGGDERSGEAHHLLRRSRHT
jgi:hypothetical protein